MVLKTIQSGTQILDTVILRHRGDIILLPPVLPLAFQLNDLLRISLRQIVKFSAMAKPTQSSYGTSSMPADRLRRQIIDTSRR